MKKSIIFLSFISLLLITTCHKKSPTETPTVNNIHPQANIPWPSLADSPWPMYHHDPQSTGRSQYKGPRQGKIKWTFKPDSSAFIWPGIIIGPDSTVYFSTIYEKTRQGKKSFLYALNPDGALKWKYQFNDCNFSDYAPLIVTDGTIFLGVIMEM